MESVGAMFDGEWSNSNSEEEADFMAQLLGNCSLPNNEVHISKFGLFSSWPIISQETYNSSEETGGGGGGGGGEMYSFIPFSSSLHGGGYCYPPPPITGGNYIGILPGGKTLHQQEMPETFLEDKEYETSKKRPRIPLHVKKKRIVKPKKNKDEKDDDESSEDDELNGGANNLNGKTRASRGSATDPQSLYARRRRERINERLKMLQKLVPNGTKVDISTMLDEAVQYVKFLQLQIKLLSSDDMWMYAPIAYNGMDIGLDFNIDAPKPS